MAYLEPLDLVALARTSKLFRDFLVSEKSVQFWNAARRNVDPLPERPEAMSEPAFISLLFSAHCHVRAS